MYRSLFKLGKHSSVVLTVTFLLAGNSIVQAQTTPESAFDESRTADIRRTDVAYKTLQELQAKYDCVPGNGALFNGKKPTVNRAEFAAGVSSCVQSIEELVARRPRKPVKRRSIKPTVAPAPEVAPEAAPQIVAPPVAPEVVPAPPAPATVQPPASVESNEAAEVPVTQQDLDRVKALTNAFGEELQALDAKIKKNSFSTTTKLVGEGIIAFSGYGGVPATNNRLDSNNIFTNRLRLNFDTSFNGKDRLRSRLQARDTTNLTAATGTGMARLGFDGNDVSDNNSILSVFQYDLPLGSQTKVRVATTGYEFNDNQPTLNPQLSSSANGSISRFGRFNPIFRLSGDGAAVNLSHKLTDELSFDVGYAVPGSGAVNPTAVVTPGNGFFKGQNAVLSQLTYAPSKEFSVAALYGRTYSNAGNLSGGTGSAAANNPFAAIASTYLPTTGTAPANSSAAAAVGNGTYTANHYSFLATYKLGDTSDSPVISGWAGFVDAAQTTGGGTASISNYAVTLAFPDFGAEGNMLGFIVGMPPKLTARNVTTNATTGATSSLTGNPDTSLHLEAVYKIKLNDNMDITPGLLVITNPEHNSGNPTEYVGTMRTTFRF